MCEDGYLFDIEMLLLASQRGLRIAEVPIEWHEMPGGKLSLWRDAWSMHRQLRRLHRKVSRIPRFHFEVSRKTLDTGSSNP
jgi:dolichyl-phosphate beta-glucosyltransferase